MVAVRWGVDKETLEELEKTEAVNPHILLSVVNVTENLDTYSKTKEKRGVETDRKLIPLEEMMAYTSFKKPGTNMIYSTIVWNADGDTKKLKQRFLTKKGRNNWDTYVTGYQGIDFRPGNITNYYTRTGIAELEMKVDENFFAKKPFDETWVECVATPAIGYKAEDQCGYRRRRIFAYTIQPLLIALSFVVRFFGAFVLGILIGRRNIKYKAVYQLIDKDINEVWRHNDQSVFTYKNSNDYKKQPWWMIFLMPVWYVSPTIIAFTVYLSDITIMPFHVVWTAPLVILGLFMTIIIIYYTGVVAYHAFIGILVLLFGTILAPIKKLIRKCLAKITAPKKKERTKRREQEIKNLIVVPCSQWPEITYLPNTESVPVSVSTLPKNKQTIYLRYMDLKAKVCKPFAR